jgi:hypothetical protein
LTNFGSTALTSATINWSVDGVNQTPYSWSGNLAFAASSSPVAVGNYNFPTGYHALKVWASAPNAGTDLNNSNDTSSSYLNYSGPLNGTYTIGGASADFPTIQAAIADLGTLGVSGPVTFNVTPNSGPYTGGFEFGVIPGISATNTVEFNGNMNTINEGTPTFIVGFNGASYITIDSFNIAVTSPTINKFGILVRGASKYLNFTNNIITLGNNTSSSTSIPIAVSNSATSGTTAGNAGQNITISNNTLSGGYYGITMFGAASYLSCTGHIISNNKIKDAYAYAIYLSNCDTVMVSGNEIWRPTRTTLSTFVGAYMVTCRNMKIVSNKVHSGGVGSYTAYGFYLSPSVNTLGYETEFINNAIYNIPTTGTFYGIYVLGTGTSRVNLYYNTIHFTTQVAAATTRGIFVSVAPNNFNIYNNNISIQGPGTGTKYCIYMGATDATMMADYNNYYMAAGGTANYIGYWSATNRNTLLDWQTATSKDLTSVSANPGFFATSDYHCNAVQLFMAGTPIPGITTDLEGDLRNPSTPCIGADEYMLYSNDAGVFAYTEPLSTCPGAATVKVSVKNYGISNLNSVVVNWSVNNVTQTPVTFTNTIAPSATDIATLGSYTFAAGVSYDFKFWTSNPNSVADQNTSNDTLAKLNFKTALNGIYTIGPSPANYQTIAAAVADLNANGVCGPVVFNVAAGSGPYQGGFALDGILGISATNTITFNGNANVINSATEQTIVTFNNVSYITFSNFQLKVANPLADSKFGIRISGASRYLNITNNLIDLGITSTSTLSAGIVATGSPSSAITAGNNGQYLNISNNTIIGGYYGITLLGNSSYLDNYGHTVSNNVIKDFYYYGIYLANADSSVVSGNNINRATRTSITTFYGIYASTSRFIKYHNNRVHSSGAGSYSSYPIYLTTSANSVGYESEIINNAIVNTPTTSTSYGIYLGTVTGVKTYHNTIHLVALSSNTIYGVYYSGAPNLCELKNNIIAYQGTGTGTKYCIYTSATSTSFVSDNNVLFRGASAGTNNMGYWSATARLDLAAWQAATLQDNFSIDSDPVLASPTTANFTPLSTLIDNMGTPVGITTDINNAVRSASTPDVGALEFTGVNSDLGITNAKLVAGQCLSTSDSIYVTVSNFIGSAIDFSVTPTTVQWNAIGPVNSSGSFIINSGILAPATSAVYGAVGVNLSIPGNYSLSNVNIVPNTFNLYAGNDTIKNLGAVTVYNPFYVEPSEVVVYDPTTTVDITAKSRFLPGSGFYFSELCNYKYTVGQPSAGWPSYLIADDYVEITGIPNSDLGGYVFEAWNTTSLVYAYTFPTGTLLGPNGTAIIGIGQLTTSVPDPANYYYQTVNSVTFGSGDIAGRLLKDGSGNVVDAVGYGNFTFPAASNVTAADWSSPNTASGSTTSGFRLIGPDNNTGSNWVLTSATYLQDPNTVNTGTFVPVPGVITGFSWSLNSQVINNNVVDTTVGPFTSAGQYNYVASYVTPCGTLTDTVNITVQLPTYSPSDTICSGDTAMLQVWLPGVAPWKVIVTDGSGIDTITGITSMPWTTYATPTVTTSYKLLHWSFGTNPYYSFNDSIVITVNPSPVVSIGTFADECSNSLGLVLSGGLPAGGTYSGSGVSNGVFNPALAGVGTFPITYTYTDANGCSGYAMSSINVNASPVASAGPDQTICQGDTALLQVSTGSFATDLFFSEYVEGSSNNKALEIFNGTGATVSLSNYRINQSSNGNGWAFIHTFPANATLAHGATWVIITNQTDSILFPAANADEVLAFPSVVHHNGDDARGLEKNVGGVWTLIDLIGDPNNDPGTAWPVAGVNNGTAEHTLIRKPQIIQGNTNWVQAAGIDSLSSEWVVLPQNFFSGLGNHIFLPATGGTLSYNWSTGDTLPVALVAPTATTTYTVTVTNASNCSIIDTVVVFVNPTPVASITAPNDTICLSHVAILDAGVWSSYAWSTGATSQTIQVVGSVLGVGTHPFSVTVTDANGCDGTASFTLIVDPCTGIDETSNELSINVYPNPTEGMISLNIQGLDSDFSLKVLNIQGQVVMSEFVANRSNSYLRTLDLSNLTNGVYFLEVRSNDMLKVEKVVLK